MDSPFVPFNSPRLLPPSWWQQSIAHLAGLAPIQPFVIPAFKAAGINVDIKREDLLCRYLGGNKLYKLHCHVQRALQLDAHTLVSFGGAFSNHVYALARAGAELGMAVRIFIRGEASATLSPTLHDVKKMGAHLVFISREHYRQKHTGEFARHHGLNERGLYVIPEGGGDLRGALGMAVYADAVIRQNPHYDALLMAAGTGASMAGLMAATNSSAMAVHGILALKGSPQVYQQFAEHTLRLASAVRRLLVAREHRSPLCWQLHTDFHGGGYGPAKAEQAASIRRLTQITHVELDPVYTGKMAVAIETLAQRATWPEGSRILVIHSGGLQGGRPVDTYRHIASSGSEVSHGPVSV